MRVPAARLGGAEPSAEHLRLATRGGNVGTYDIDLLTGQGVWSDSVFEMLGLAPAPGGRAPIDSWAARLHPDDREAVRAQSQAALAQGRLELEFRALRADTGALRWLACYGHILTEQGRPVRSVGVIVDRSQQKQAEQALADSEARLRRAQEAGGVGSYEWDMATGAGRLSDSMLKMIGLPTGRSYRLKEIIAPILPEDLPQVQATVAAINSGTARRETEYRIRRLTDGAIRWIRDVGQFDPGGDGVPPRWVGIVQDVTEQVEAQRALQASEERLRLGLAAGRMVVWDFDAETQRVSRSDNAEEVFGPGETLADFHARMDPEAIARDAALLAAAIAAPDRHFVSEYRYRHPDGRLLWLHNQGQALRDPDGVVRRVHGVCMDVTARREMEERLRASEARFRGVFESDLLGFAIYDLAGYTTLAVNDRMLAILGVARADFDLAAWDWREHTPPEYLPADEAAIAQARARGWWDGFEKEYVRADGSRVPVRLLSAPLPDEPGRVLVAVEDISERKRAQERQRLLINELNHRVKNTLAIVQAIAQQSFRDELVPPDVRKAFDGRLTALSAAHSLLTEQNWEAASLTQIIGDALAAVRGRDARVTLAGPDLMLQPKTAVSLAMAIHELATNAVKYGSLSVPGGTVSVDWSIDAGRLRLAWQERGGPAVRAPSRRGFGTRMIERGLAQELGGTVKIDFAADGLNCALDAPLPPAP